VVKALCYKPEGRGLEIRWGECIFSSYLVLPAALGTEVYSASTRDDFQKNNVSWELLRAADNLTAICELVA
jgi:hypothetical protein